MEGAAPSLFSPLIFLGFLLLFMYIVIIRPQNKRNKEINEMLGAMLATYHNISYYQSLMNDIRSAIKDNLFAKFIKDFYNKRNLDMPDGPI